MQIPKELLGQYPEIRDGQCEHYKNRCVCGEKFPDLDIECANCGQQRNRCGNIRSKNSKGCRVHATNKITGIKKQLLERFSGINFEDALAGESNSLEEEKELARILLRAYISRFKDKNLSHFRAKDFKDAIGMCHSVVEMSKTLQRIERGDNIRLEMNEEGFRELKKYVHKVVFAVEQALKEFLPEDELRTKIIARIQDLVRTKGNLIDVELKPAQNITDANYRPGMFRNVDKPT